MSTATPAGAWCRLDDRALLRVTGEDATSFLQGLISNDMRQLAEAPAIYAALLTPQGKYLFDFLVVADDGGVLLDVEAARRAALLQRLTLYRLRAKVELTAADNLQVFVRFGAEPPSSDAPAGVRAFPDPRHAGLGWRVVGPAKPTSAWLSTGGEEVPATAYLHQRLALGVAEGSPELAPDQALLLESGFVELNGVCFDKGCFVGQELTARMRYRATVRKRVLPVHLTGTAEPGTPIRDGEIEVGQVLASDGAQGLALVRLDRWQKARDADRSLQADAAVVEPWVPNWVDLSLASRSADSSA